MPSYLDVPYPANTAGALMPADMQLAIEALAPRQVLQVSGPTERDSKYGDLPTGTVVVTTAAPWYVWLKTDSATPTWRTLHYDSGKITSGFTYPTDWSVGGWAWVREINGVVYVNVEAVWGGADFQAGDAAASNPGNLSPDMKIVTLPVAYAPSDYVTTIAGFAVSLGALTIYQSGDATVTTMNTAGWVHNGQYCRFSASYPKAS